ncbi:hypothetical protein CRV24_004009 [Beauveria bassiana]|nr:hypothetical protein CRV24_004009 [Beauveria bassiana]
MFKQSHGYTVGLLFFVQALIASGSRKPLLGKKCASWGHIKTSFSRFAEGGSHSASLPGCFDSYSFQSAPLYLVSDLTLRPSALFHDFVESYPVMSTIRISNDATEVISTLHSRTNYPSSAIHFECHQKPTLPPQAKLTRYPQTLPPRVVAGSPPDQMVAG